MVHYMVHKNFSLMLVLQMDKLALFAKIMKFSEVMCFEIQRAKVHFNIFILGNFARLRFIGS